MEKIYLVICDYGDCECSAQRVCSAWKNFNAASREKERLEQELKQKIDEEDNKNNFCNKCPLNDYNILPKKAESLAKAYCKNFAKSDLSVEDETFCDNRYQSTAFLDDWCKYRIEEIKLN